MSVGSLEERVERLEKRVDKLIADLSTEQQNLRELGLRNGSKGVAAAFVLVGGVFISNVAFTALRPSEKLFAFSEFLWLVGLVTIGLLFYFAFIFGYNMLLDYRAGRLGADRQSPRETQNP